MIRLSVYYPATEGATFDHDYYCNKHVPLAVKAWGLDGAEIDKGVDGPYVAAVHFRFESLDALRRAMGWPAPARCWPTSRTTRRSSRCCRRARSSTEPAPARPGSARARRLRRTRPRRPGAVMVDEMFSLEGRVAIVTGSGTGIGRATAQVLAEHGADVVLAARRAELLEQTAASVRDLGRRALVVPTDVTDSEAV